MTFFFPWSFFLSLILTIFGGSALVAHYFSINLPAWLTAVTNLFPLWQHIIVFAAGYIWCAFNVFSVLGFMYMYKNATRAYYALWTIGILVAPIALLVWFIFCCIMFVCVKFQK